MNAQQTADLVLIIQRLYRSSYMPVKTMTVAIHYCCSEEQALRYLKQLHADGKIKRVGERIGWLPLET